MFVLIAVSHAGHKNQTTMVVGSTVHTSLVTPLSGVTSIVKTRRALHVSAKSMYVVHHHVALLVSALCSSFVLLFQAPNAIDHTMN